jgi:hypothetical protein
MGPLGWESREKKSFEAWYDKASRVTSVVKLDADSAKNYLLRVLKSDNGAASKSDVMRAMVARHGVSVAPFSAAHAAL